MSLLICHAITMSFSLSPKPDTFYTYWRIYLMNTRLLHIKWLQVAWLRVDTQTILTIAAHVITKNHRIAVNHSDRRVWFLHIHDVRQSDRGWYMCQLNTDPMKSQTAYLDVVGLYLF